MRKLKALDLGATPAWVKVRPMADWALELFCQRCGCTGSVKQRDLPKQREAVERWFAHHSRCPEKNGG